MERIDAVVIGAGVVGLACARALATRGLETIVLERHNAFGTETSARNSEVIHGGIYYPTGSLKARLCVAGRDALYDFCTSHHVAHRRCGKLIVATSSDQKARLATLAKQAAANGVTDLAWLTAQQARDMEPALHCVAALHSPSTGIIDSHGLMLALLGDAERNGATLAVGSPFRHGRVLPDGFALSIDDAEPLHARIVINAAGLSAPEVAAQIDGFPAALLPPCHYAKGNYFSLAGKAPFSRLVYPLPEPGGLGVHLTLDLGGQARFGPDVEWLERIDYTVDPRRADTFYAEVRRYWPALADGALQPAYAGIRPKLHAPGAAARDFLVAGPRDHGVPGLVNFFGIESPGLTASLALATHAAELLAPP